MRDSFVFYTKWSDVLMGYPAEVRYEVYDAIIRYAQSGTLSELKPLASMAFAFIKSDIDRDWAKYKEISEKRRLAGSQSGKQKVANQANASKGSKCLYNDNDNDNDNESENDIPPLIPPGGQRVGYEFFGTFKNVELKPAELRKLQMDFGESETQSAIDDLSCKLMDGTQQSNAHYATLTYWLASRRKKQQQNPQRQKSKSEKLEDSFEKTKQLLGLNDED